MSDGDQLRVRELEAELARVYDVLRSTNEDLASTTEELDSTVDELDRMKSLLTSMLDEEPG